MVFPELDSDEYSKRFFLPLFELSFPPLQFYVKYRLDKGQLYDHYQDAARFVRGGNFHIPQPLVFDPGF